MAARAFGFGSPSGNRLEAYVTWTKNNTHIRWLLAGLCSLCLVFSLAALVFRSPVWIRISLPRQFRVRFARPSNAISPLTHKDNPPPESDLIARVKQVPLPSPAAPRGQARTCCQARRLGLASSCSLPARDRKSGGLRSCGWPRRIHGDCADFDTIYEVRSFSTFCTTTLAKYIPTGSAE